LDGDNGKDLPDSDYKISGGCRRFNYAKDNRATSNRFQFRFGLLGINDSIFVNFN
jgi:hypothetical protein